MTVPSRLAAALVGLLLITACTPPGLPAPLTPTVTAPETAESPTPPGTLSIGVDVSPTGFNPHAIADFSLPSRTVTELVLPSVSRIAASGFSTLNRDLVESASVTSTDPFTVTYRLRSDAAWSDGTPVTAEDFAYLAEQMVSQEGTIAPAGYRSIDEVISKDAGKTVVVVFTRRVVDWVGLFSPLLPSHLMRDSPGGWSQALAQGLPVSGGQYKMASFDTETGQLELVRNDKYWGEQPGPVSVTFRVGEPAVLRQALDRGDLDIIVTSGSLVPAGRAVTSIPVGATVQLMMATTEEPSRDVRLRRAVGLALNRASLIDLLAGRGPAVGVASLLPTTPTLNSQLPPVGLTYNPTAAKALLEEAGFEATAGIYRHQADGQVVRLTVGVPADRPDFDRAAGVIRADLAAVGIETTIVRDTAASILSRLQAGTLNLALVERPSVPSVALTAVSEFGCGAGPATQTDIDDDRDVGDAVVAVGNPLNYCRAGVDNSLLAHVEGESTSTPPEARLLRDLPTIPLQRPVWQVEYGATVQNVISGTPAPVGWSWTGPLARLGSWAPPP